MPDRNKEEKVYYGSWFQRGQFTVVLPSVFKGSIMVTGARVRGGVSSQDTRKQSRVMFHDLLDWLVTGSHCVPLVGL